MWHIANQMNFQQKIQFYIKKEDKTYFSYRPVWDKDNRIYLIAWRKQETTKSMNKFSKAFWIIFNICEIKLYLGNLFLRLC